VTERCFRERAGSNLGDSPGTAPDITISIEVPRMNGERRRSIAEARARRALSERRDSCPATKRLDMVLLGGAKGAKAGRPTRPMRFAER